MLKGFCLESKMRWLRHQALPQLICNLSLDQLGPEKHQQIFFLKGQCVPIPQVTYIPIEYHGVCPVSTRWHWDPHPLSRKRVYPPPRNHQRGGGHTRLRVKWWGNPNSDDWRERLALALCLLCDPSPNVSVVLTPSPECWQNRLKNLLHLILKRFYNPFTVLNKKCMKYVSHFVVSDYIFWIV